MTEWKALWLDDGSWKALWLVYDCVENLELVDGSWKGPWLVDGCGEGVLVYGFGKPPLIG
jgi:hypothetical protein